MSTFFHLYTQPLRGDLYIKKQVVIQVLFALVLLFTMIIAVTMGRYTISLGKVFYVLTNGLTNPELVENSVEYTVLFKVRLPRILLSIFTGMV